MSVVTSSSMSQERKKKFMKKDIKLTCDNHFENRASNHVLMWNSTCFDFLVKAVLPRKNFRPKRLHVIVRWGWCCYIADRAVWESGTCHRRAWLCYKYFHLGQRTVNNNTCVDQQHLQAALISRVKDEIVSEMSNPAAKKFGPQTMELKKENPENTYQIKAEVAR